MPPRAAFCFSSIICITNFGSASVFRPPRQRYALVRSAKPVSYNFVSTFSG